MSNSSREDDPELLELIAGRTLGDLSAEEQSKIDSSWSERTRGDAEELDRTAAAVALMFANENRIEIPDDLRARIREDAGDYLRGAARNSAFGGSSNVELSQRESFQRREIFAWIAVAASLLLAVGLWVSQQQRSATAPTMVAARTQLIQDAEDLIRVDWGPGKTPFESEVKGDIVWSTASQKGYMRFLDMPQNDPTIQQYQLWIIDPERDDEPIDGGVFDVAESGEVIIPIDAKLDVIAPAAFAVTIEKPGGVVVSTQERLPLLAAVN